MTNLREPVRIAGMSSAISALGLILLMLGGFAARAQESGDPVAGASFAETACGSCHATHARQTGSPNADAPAFQVVADMPSMTGTALTVWLRTSHPTMPNLQLTPAETANVIAYIQSLRTKRE